MMQNKGTANGYIPEVDVLKGFAMICMIIGHSIIVYPIDISHVPWCEGLHRFIYSFHMELLFLLSGFLYKKKDLVSYLKGKIHRILIPYLIWGGVFLLMPVLFSSLVHRETSLTDGIINYLLYGGGYWFLYVLFLIFLIYPLIDLLSKWLKVGLIIFLLAINLLLEVPDILCIKQIVFYLPFFMAGNLIAHYYKKERGLSFFDRYMGFLGLFFICMIIANQYTPFPKYPSNLIYTISISGLIWVATRIIFIQKDVTNDILFNKLVSFTSLCGQYSLQLYLFNGFLLVLLRVLLCSILHISNPIVLVTVISVVDIFISLLVCKYLLPKSRFLSYICGVKPSNN